MCLQTSRSKSFQGGAPTTWYSKHLEAKHFELGHSISSRQTRIYLHQLLFLLWESPFNNRRRGFESSKGLSTALHIPQWARHADFLFGRRYQWQCHCATIKDIVSTAACPLAWCLVLQDAMSRRTAAGGAEMCCITWGSFPQLAPQSHCKIKVGQALRRTAGVQKDNLTRKAT